MLVSGLKAWGTTGLFAEQTHLVDNVTAHTGNKDKTGRQVVVLLLDQSGGCLCADHRAQEVDFNDLSCLVHIKTD